MLAFKAAVGAFLAFIVLSSAGVADIIFVDDSATGANNGTSWQDAYIDLQDALTAAQTGDEIRVGQGTYKPDGPGGSVDATFAFIDVIVHGGFAGVGAVDPDANDPAAFVTTLSADLNGDDPGPPTMSAPFTDNVHHVVTISASTASARLVGVVVTHGIAVGNSSALEDQGAGILNVAGSATIMDCRIIENLAFAGAGMCNRDGASPSIVHCAFVDNHIVPSGPFGGGVYNLNSTPAFTDCEFTGNGNVGAPGGAMLNKGSMVHATDCTFANNRASGGGGLVNENSSDGTFDRCTFQDNLADAGAAMENSASSPTVSNCIFIGNDAEEGGAVSNYTNANAHFESCLFQENTHLFGGGGMNNHASNPTVINCSFRQNHATSTLFTVGGGMRNTNASSPTLINCEFVGNIADQGGGMINVDTSSPTLINCTIAGSQPNGINCFATAVPTLHNCVLWANSVASFIGPAASSITYSDVEGGWPGQGNIDVDPQFEDLVAGNVKLASGSPCIDAADNSAVPADATTDLGGDPRFVDDPATTDTGNGTAPIVDMGAFEFQGPSQKCVADISPKGGDGTVDTNDLQMVIDNWGQAVGNPADITGDGIVNTGDLLAVINAWGPCP